MLVISDVEPFLPAAAWRKTPQHFDPCHRFTVSTSKSLFVLKLIHGNYKHGHAGHKRERSPACMPFLEGGGEENRRNIENSND